jgi:hypothetical protein
VDADFFRLRPRRPASAASFSSCFLRASVMSSKLMTLAFLTTVDLIDARVLLSLFVETDQNSPGTGGRGQISPSQLYWRAFGDVVDRDHPVYARPIQLFYVRI